MFHVRMGRKAVCCGVEGLNELYLTRLSRVSWRTVEHFEFVIGEWPDGRIIFFAELSLSYTPRIRIARKTVARSSNQTFLSAPVHELSVLLLTFDL